LNDNIEAHSTKTHDLPISLLRMDISQALMARTPPFSNFMLTNLFSIKCLCPLDFEIVLFYAFLYIISLLGEGIDQTIRLM
jgi:hypothetical protein